MKIGFRSVNGFIRNLGGDFFLVLMKGGRRFMLIIWTLFISKGLLNVCFAEYKFGRSGFYNYSGVRWIRWKIDKVQKESYFRTVIWMILCLSVTEDLIKFLFIDGCCFEFVYIFFVRLRWFLLWYTILAVKQFIRWLL